MFKSKNPLVNFMILGISLAIFIVLFVLLLKILVIGLLIGFVMFAFFWIKQKLFPQTKRNTLDEQIKRFVDGLNQNANHSAEHDHIDAYQRTSKKHANTGRIIDVDPEDK